VCVCVCACVCDGGVTVVWSDDVSRCQEEIRCEGFVCLLVCLS
jgi:hypothetical protein